MDRIVNPKSSSRRRPKAAGLTNWDNARTLDRTPSDPMFTFYKVYRLLQMPKAASFLVLPGALQRSHVLWSAPR
jgi:hypothetical protein